MQNNGSNPGTPSPQHQPQACDRLKTLTQANMQVLRVPRNQNQPAHQPSPPPPNSDMVDTDNSNDVSFKRWPPQEISYDMIAKCFSMPMKDAAEKFGRCLSSFKKLCRSYGIKRWPHRELKSYYSALSYMNSDETKEWCVGQVLNNYVHDKSRPSPQMTSWQLNTHGNGVTDVGEEGSNLPSTPKTPPPRATLQPVIEAKSHPSVLSFKIEPFGPHQEADPGEEVGEAKSSRPNKKRPKEETMAHDDEVETRLEKALKVLPQSSPIKSMGEREETVELAAALANADMLDAPSHHHGDAFGFEHLERLDEHFLREECDFGIDLPVGSVGEGDLDHWLTFQSDGSISPVSSSLEASSDQVDPVGQLPQTSTTADHVDNVMVQTKQGDRLFELECLFAREE